MINLLIASNKKYNNLDFGVWCLSGSGKRPMSYSSSEDSFPPGPEVHMEYKPSKRGRFQGGKETHPPRTSP